MKICALVFRSIHDVLAAEKRLLEKGWPVRMIPVPKQVNPDCGMALQFSCDDWPSIQPELADFGPRLQQVYEVEGTAFTPLEKQ